MSRSSLDGLVVLGHVAGAHGIKGWVKVVSHSDPRQGILDYSPWYIRPNGGEWREVKLLSGRPQGKGLCAQLEGCTDRDQALALRGAEIAVTPQQLKPLDDDEFYWYQLEGLQVVHQGEATDAYYGVIDHLLATGANDVMVVKPTPDSIDDRERLIPYLPERVVRSIDLDAGVVSVDWEPDF